MTSRHWALVGGPAHDQVALVVAADDDRGCRVAWFGDWHGERLSEAEAFASAGTEAPIAHPRRQRWGARLDAAAPSDLWAGEGGAPNPVPAVQYQREGGDWTFLPDRIEVRRPHPQRLEVEQTDAAAALTLTVVFELDPATGVLEVASRLSNVGTKAVTVGWCAAVELPLPFWADHLLDHAGDWCAEFQRETRPLGAAGLLRESREGRSGHAHPPVLVIGAGQPRAADGRMLGIQLAWSGNHRERVDRRSDGTDVAQLGVLPLGSELQLDAGGSWQSPAAFCAVSRHGLDGLTERFSAACRARILPRTGQRWPRPVHLNTWEALYFDHGSERLKALVATAAAVGVERFVLDDGWFRGRRNDRRGLGDWSADPMQYPAGLGPLIDHVRDLRMQFGLWIEPEMVSEDSELFRKHPGWVRGQPGRPPLYGRHQRVLDLGQPEVCDHLFAVISGLLQAHPIDYLKWDHNRVLTESAVGGGPGHLAQVAGLYALLDRLRSVHPEVEIESCASGGGRADWGMLQRCHRVWPSDSNDPVVRARIMAGAGLFAPPEVLGVHIGPQRAHTTGRVSDLDFRAAVALLGHFGLELDLTALDAGERARLGAHIERYKRLRELLHAGRHAQPVFDADHLVRIVTAEDRRRAVVMVLRLDDQRPGRPVRFALADLDPALRYRLTLAEPLPDSERRPVTLVGAADFNSPGMVVGGAWLVSAGLTLQLPAPQSAVVIELQACG
ncbi:MAG: alpha-galactosidase [Gammaproteobacteria bacterium]|nr:alpha-galactosidase [Gammaproteobacteria bacterium]